MVGSSGDRMEAERECARLKPDIAVIDWLLLSDTSGVNVAEAIRRCSAGTKLVIFLAASEAHFVNDAIAAGVSGFVVKSATIETLAKALGCGRRGQAVLLFRRWPECCVNSCNAPRMERRVRPCSVSASARSYGKLPGAAFPRKSLPLLIFPSSPWKTSDDESCGKPA